MSVDFTVQVGLLEEQLLREIKRLEASRDKDKKKAKRATILVSAGTAGATMLLGLSKFVVALEIQLQAASLVLGTVTTIIVAWDKLFEHKKLWVLSAQTVRNLYRLKEKMDHAIKNGEMNDPLAKHFFDEYHMILSLGDQKWDALRKD